MKTLFLSNVCMDLISVADCQLLIPGGDLMQMFDKFTGNFPQIYVVASRRIEEFKTK